jgi:hypothetical protein
MEGTQNDVDSRLNEERGAEIGADKEYRRPLRREAERRRGEWGKGGLHLAE